MLELVLFGGFEVHGIDRIKIPKKGKALLAVLALDGERPRELIADLLWPYQGNEQSRHSLRNLLLAVRKAAPEIVRGTFDSCRLGDGVTSDVGKLIKCAFSDDLGHRRQVLNLYRGPLLDGFLIDSEPFGEWLAAERMRLQEIAISALCLAATSASSAGDHDLATTAARRAVQIEPFHEDSTVVLIDTLVAADRRSAAARSYIDCAALLKRELGVTPGEGLQAAARMLRDSGGITPFTVPETPKISTRGSPQPNPTPNPTRVPKEQVSRLSSRLEDLISATVMFNEACSAMSESIGTLTEAAAAVKRALDAAAAAKTRNDVRDIPGVWKDMPRAGASAP